jgi:CubicO group peptidase (beta-lactamase class C family)
VTAIRSSPPSGPHFEGNFENHGEPGAAVCHVHIHGRPVVDLWGGWSNLEDTQPWARDTLVNVFSVGKAFTAICVLQLCERGILDLDRSLWRGVWPDFAANGKDAITLRHVLSHRAGLPRIAPSTARRLRCSTGPP